jgi:hypothetical protein
MLRDRYDPMNLFEGYDTATGQDVVGEDHPARPNESHTPLEVCRVRFLVSIDERQVEWRVGAEGREEIERCAHAHVSPVGQSCVRQVFPRDLCVSLVDLQRDQAPVGRQCARKMNRTVSAKRADLQHAPRSCRLHENPEQAPKFRRHLDGAETGRDGSLERSLQLRIRR